MRQHAALALLLVFTSGRTTERPPPADFVLSKAGHSTTLVISDSDWAGVRRAAADLQSDIQRVSGAPPELTNVARGTVVLIGTLGKSPWIDQLVREGKLERSTLSGRWETYVRQVIEHPLPNVDRALVIAGSDKRGTIYGIYDLSRAIGVSPWYWWADVPVRHAATLYRTARRVHRRRAGGEVPRHLHQRRGAGVHRLGAREVRRHQPSRLRARLRADSAAQGQLPLAGDVGQRVHRRRSARTPSSPTNTAS